MKIIVIGTRGIPNIQGGVETHCEELYPRLVAMGCDVTIVRRSCYVSADNKTTLYKGVKLKDIYAPKLKSLEAITHTFLAVFYAWREKADILHIHAIGNTLMAPVARALGLRVIMTHHGPDYDRQKWGRLAKLALKAGEYMGAKYANSIIVISEVIDKILRTKYNRTDAILIFNGVNIPVKSTGTEYIHSLGLEANKYLLTVGRFVEEKGFDILINVFSRLPISQDMKLAIAGDALHETEYTRRLVELAKSKGIVLPGFIKGEKLNEIYTHARLFVLPSFHEGLPICLLEAMSYGLEALVSDIPAHLAVRLPESDYYKTGDNQALAEGLMRKLSFEKHDVSYYLEPYNWDKIAKLTLSVYQKEYEKCQKLKKV
ncbi:MAG: glycosyltransferase family 4 protein [Bacteroidales bacterium]|jgi:glycosyltransferase involved in cell wall biosynthesis|nr:glycosyltransferase family 4 protein [Bacteroidales bacterium]